MGEADLALMRLSDEIQLQLPCYGSRRIGDELKDRGLTVTDSASDAPSRGGAQVAPGRGYKVYP